MKRYAQRGYYLHQPAPRIIARSPARAFLLQDAAHPILHLQRTIGNQAVLRRYPPQARSAHGTHAARQPAAPAAMQRQPAPADPFARGGVYDQIDIVREAQLPLEFFEQPDIRQLSFDERQTLEFRRKLEAIGKLGDARNERAVRVLVQVVEDTLPAVQNYNPQQKLLLRDAAVEALGKIGGQAALTKLSDLLNSKDPKDRALAARGLGGTTGGASVTALLGRLKTESDAGVKAQIISALGNVGRGSSSSQEKQAIVTELISQMENNVGPVKLAAIDALGQVGLKTATDPLLKQLKLWLNQADIAQHVVTALGEIRDPQAVELLVIMLEKHGSKSVRSEAALALGKIGGPKAQAALQRRLTEETDAGVKASITKALP